MIKLMTILTGLFLFSCPVFAADETNKTPPAAQAATGERAGASEVAAEAGARLRDPFWPIGFFPVSMPGGASRPVGSELDKETTNQVSGLSGMLRIGGVIKKGNKFYVTINGFTVQTGEVVSVISGGEIYKFIVEKIDFNKVQFKPLRR